MALNPTMSVLIRGGNEKSQREEASDLSQGVGCPGLRETQEDGRGLGMANLPGNLVLMTDRQHR